MTQVTAFWFDCKTVALTNQYLLGRETNRHTLIIEKLRCKFLSMICCLKSDALIGTNHK